MTANPRIRVKFLSRIKLPDGNIGDSFLRRFPNQVPSLGRCDFLFDPAERNYDWLVVYDDLPRDKPEERLACPKSNTHLLTGEPSSITDYGKHFLAQFGHVLTSQEPWALKHPNIIRRQPGLLWFYGGADERGTYDHLVSTPPPVETKLISTVCSTKAMRHTLHSLRLEFTKRLKQDLPELDVFGYGMGHLENKADAISPYRYHLVIENHSCPHHWTEKLADAYLGYSLPIYFGCTNVADYFPPDSFIQIDIRDYSAARATIEQTLLNDDYPRRLPAVIEARRRVLHDYATFPQLARLITARHLAKSDSAPVESGIILRGRHAARARAPFSGLLDLFEKARRKSARPG